MNKKNRSLLKWALGAMLILALIPLANPQLLKNLHMPTASDLSSPGRFLSYLEDFFSLYFNSVSSDITSVELNLNALLNLGHVPGEAGYVSPSTLPADAGLNGKASQGNNPSANQGANQEPNSLANSANNTNPEPATINSESNISTNSETGSSAPSGDMNAGNGSQNNSANNSPGNSDQGAGNQPGTSSGDNSGSNLASGSGTNQGAGNSGDNNPNNSSGPSNPNNLPTINPIPSDDTVSQSITQQNNQRDSMAELLAKRQALIAPIQEEAQNSKYQPVTAPSAPDPNAATVSADILEKFKSHKITINH